MASVIRLLDHTFPSPEENLAFDDRLLEDGQETLRFWESPAPCVVLGRSGRETDEIHPAACRELGVAVLRRRSGGGAVLLGPGCLNYTLLLSPADHPELSPVSASYRIILEEIARALAIPGLEVAGTDLLLSDRKVSGNAQRRTKDWLLHHGTLLYGMDLALMERVLREPRKQPPHRRARNHREFLGSLPLHPEEIKKRLSAAWR